jgi:hypothetical protein
MGAVGELRRRARRIEVTNIDRASIISYAYSGHYVFYSILLICMHLAGAFSKNTEESYYLSLSAGFAVDNV